MVASERSERLDYGFNTPGFLPKFIMLALGAAAAAVILGVMGFTIISVIAGVISAFFVFCAVYLVIGNKFLKLRARDAILSRIAWRGDETVLDIGCGHGLLLIGAAKNLTTGRAIGVDIWDQDDQYDNHPENTMRNARIEGVDDRVEVRTADARKLDFPDESFDVIVSSVALHDVGKNAAERAEVIHNIIRVLKPGGQIAIYDFKHLPEYQQIFIESGIEQVQITGWLRWYLALARLLTGIKPKSANA
jgi:ubiquinone/menaquinone biosynthesis C-methylase UbiE